MAARQTSTKRIVEGLRWGRLSSSVASRVSSGSPRVLVRHFALVPTDWASVENAARCSAQIELHGGAASTQASGGCVLSDL